MEPSWNRNTLAIRVRQQTGGSVKSAKILQQTAATNRNGSVHDSATTGQTPPQPISAAQLFQGGKLLFQLGKMDEAESKFNTVLKSEPQNQAGIFLLI